MDVDPEHLRHHYASLSDAGLAEIDRADLVPIAQRCYDDEITCRRLQKKGADLELPAPLTTKEVAEREVHSGPEAIPSWLEESAEVYSVNSHPGSYAGKDVDKAREALESAGIPCCLEFCEDRSEKQGVEPEYRWRVLVPGKLNMRATSLLDRDIFNDEFDSLWRTHLEMLSDEELHDAQPREVFCGLFDRIERVIKAYSDELSQRGLNQKRP